MFYKLILPADIQDALTMSFGSIRYINEDQLIVPMLKMLRDSGRATFLVTNRYILLPRIACGEKAVSTKIEIN